MATATLTTVSTLPASIRTPRWLHAVAVLTALMAMPLLFLGAEVTTKQVGMVDQQGLRQPWHLFSLISEKGLGYFADPSNWGLLIEHSHRTVGWVVGICAIVLAVGLGFAQKNRILRWMGIAALLAVILQGLLGILRVNLHLGAPGMSGYPLAGREFALIHGCTAQLVFALLVSVAYLTSSIWDDGFSEGSENIRLRRLSLVTASLIYLQIIVGAVVRHLDSELAPRVHLLVAFGVVAAVTALAWSHWNTRDCDVRLSRPLSLLVVLVGVQLFLGVEAWLSKFATGSLLIQLKPLTEYPDLTRSLHLLVGSVLFACSVVVALRVYLGRIMATQSGAAPLHRLEGAA
jgi:cytochrome c oxidase assembly protein subunit 15